MARSTWLASVIAAFCCAIPPSRAQTNDWNSVMRLAPGTAISVVKRARQECRVVAVTDVGLDCEHEIGNVERRLAFAREQVREIRLEQFEDNHMLACAIIGAAIGGLVGFLAGGEASDPELRGYARVYGIPLGGLMGGTIGRHIHRHGRIIYRR